jgi:putative FmdB family regulatory protein
MPIYEYSCRTCGTFETTQRITDKPLRRCPTCKGPVRKLISSTSFQLKGSGWYVTDYAGKDSSGKKGKDETKPETGAAKESKDSKESAPAAKTESKSESKAEASAA